MVTGWLGGPMHYCLGLLGIARLEMYWLTLPKPQTPNPKPQTPIPKPETLNPKS